MWWCHGDSGFKRASSSQGRTASLIQRTVFLEKAVVLPLLHSRGVARPATSLCPRVSQTPAVLGVLVSQPCLERLCRATVRPGYVPPMSFSSFGSLRGKHIPCEPHLSWSLVDGTEQYLQAPRRDKRRAALSADHTGTSRPLTSWLEEEQLAAVAGRCWAFLLLTAEGDSETSLAVCGLAIRR